MAKIIRTPSAKPAAQPKQQPTMDVGTLLSALFKKQDPTWAHLNSIIKKKNDQVKEPPLEEVRLQEFLVPGKSRDLFSREEKALIGLEARYKASVQEIANLKAKTIEIQKTSFQKGYEEGVKRGMAEGRAVAKKEMDGRIAAIQKQVATTLAEVERRRSEIFHQAEAVVLHMINRFVRKVIHVECRSNPSVLEGVTKNALRFVEQSHRITIRVHPEQARKVKDELPLWMPVNQGLKQITVEEDSRIQTGGCLIDTDTGQVDARIETMIEELETMIMETWEEKPAETQPPAAAR